MRPPCISYNKSWKARFVLLKNPSNLPLEPPHRERGIVGSVHLLFTFLWLVSAEVLHTLVWCNYLLMFELISNEGNPFLNLLVNPEPWHCSLLPQWLRGCKYTFSLVPSSWPSRSLLAHTTISKPTNNLQTSPCYRKADIFISAKHICRAWPNYGWCF